MPADWEDAGEAGQGDMSYDRRYGNAGDKKGSKDSLNAYVNAANRWGMGDERTKAAARDAMATGWGVGALGRAFYNRGHGGNGGRRSSDRGKGGGGLQGPFSPPIEGD